MSEQEAIQLIPDRVRTVLKYIDRELMNHETEDYKLNFYHTKIKNLDTCILRVFHDNKSDYFNMGILVQYDTMLYSQLLISLLDHYLENSALKLSSIYMYDNKDFSYSLYLLSSKSNSVNINIEIESSHDLEKIVCYYNERVFMKQNSIQTTKVGEKRWMF